MAFNVVNRKMDGGKTQLSLTIEGVIRTLVESGKYANIKKETECPEMADAINKILDSNFKVVINPRLSQNANVSVPLIDRNNPMWKRFLQDNFAEFLDQQSDKDLYRSSDEVLSGGIGTDGKYKGYVKDLESTITVSYDLIYVNKRWPVKAAGATGIILHEIGHFENFIKALGWTAKTNYVLMQATNRLMGVGELEKRVDVISGIIDKEKIDIEENLEVLAKLNDPKTTSLVLVGGLTRKMRHELGANVYDARGFESLSDNFAAQHGNGLDLVLALDTMPSMRMAKKGTVENLLYRVLTTHMQLVGFIMNPALQGLITFFLMLFYSPESKIYDDPYDRCKRIGQGMVANLREDRSSDPERIKEIETIFKVMEQYDNRRDFTQTCYEFLSPTGRRSKSLRELNQHLEEFANNRLYLMAGKFNNYAQ